MGNKNEILCPDERIAALLALVADMEDDGIAKVDEVMRDYPDDPRLHFLKGSLLAGAGEYATARSAMRAAVDLAPDFAIARFQLGFLLLTGGEPHAAQEAWGPLHGLEPDHYLRIFVNGLCHLIRDEFLPAIATLEKGIGINDQNPALNNDMQLIIDEIRRNNVTREEGLPTMSSAQMLLQQASIKSTRH